MTLKELHEKISTLLSEHGEKEIVARLHTHRLFHHPVHTVEPTDLGSDKKYVALHVDGAQDRT